VGRGGVGDGVVCEPSCGLILFLFYGNVLLNVRFFVVVVLQRLQSVPGLAHIHVFARRLKQSA
jgi:hypothetical protein